MKTVYKYLVPPGSSCSIDLPAGAQVLSAAFQGDDLMMWALVETDFSSVPRRFVVLGTGHGISDAISFHSLKFVATAFLGPLVFHVFEAVA